MEMGLSTELCMYRKSANICWMTEDMSEWEGVEEVKVFLLNSTWTNGISNLW